MTSKYMTSARLERLAVSLSDRERVVLETLDRLRVAKSTDLESLLFSDVTTRRARLVLASLTERQLIYRLARRIGGVRSGSAGFVYALTAAGSRLVPSSTLTRSAPPGQISDLFLAHALAVTRLNVDLAGEVRRMEDVHLQRFLAEPACWRSNGPALRDFVLKPDAEIELRTGQYEDHWFIEIDRATESRPTIARKLYRYIKYYRSGLEQSASGIFPKVLWIVPDQHRRRALTAEIDQLPASTQRLFTVETREHAVERLLAGPAG